MRIRTKNVIEQMDAAKRIENTAKFIKGLHNGTIVPEMIHWHEASEKPDTDTTVLMCTPSENQPVSLGYWDSANDMWTMYDAYPDKVDVTHWAHLPEGPKP